MDAETTVVEPEMEWSGDAPSLESLREVRLTALLADVMDELGQVKAAEKLGVDRKTLWRCRNMGKLTPRLSDALERMLLAQDLSAGMRQQKRVETLETQVAAWEGKLRSGLEAVGGEIMALREEHARAMRHIERRLMRLEAERNGSDMASPTGPEAATPQRRYIPPRTYPQLVTLDAEPDEGAVYGEATTMIVEWREARAEFLKTLKTGTALERSEAKERMLTLELAIIEEHELTLPPASYPWDRSDRRKEVWLRRQALDDARVARNRALLRRWLRRVLTCGLWRN